MKYCRYCWWEIKEIAKKCKHCHNRICEESIIKNTNSIEKLINLEKNLLIIACVILWIAIIRFWWYWYYLFARLVIFIIMIVLCVKNYKIHTENKKIWIYWITAFIYNPLFAIWLTRSFWIILDIILIIIFINIIKQNNVKTIKKD